MRKELIISIIIGFAMGLLITFGVYAFKKQVKDQGSLESPMFIEPTSIASPTITPTSQTLSLITPIDQSISTISKITLSGITSPGSWVLVIYEQGEKTVQADQSGNFLVEISLISGENEIQVKSISELGFEANKIVTIVYSTVEI